MKLLLVTAFILFSTSQIQASKRWGAKGHRTVGKIADTHLKKRTKRAINKLLNAKSLAYVSTYADEIKSDSIYDKYFFWHFANLNLAEDYRDSKKHPEGDIVMAIDHCVRAIKDVQSSDADKAFFLKFLVHLIGDLHQPMHAGLESDRGGNDFKVLWFGRETNMHRVWDTDMIENYGMSYSELATNADYLTKKELKQIQQGNVEDWFNETHELARKVYKTAQPNENLRYRYSYLHFNTARKQMQLAGIRLAKVLNDLF